MCQQYSIYKKRQTTENKSTGVRRRQLFLQLWSKKSVQHKFDGTVRNNRVFKELTDKLAEAGYQQTLLTDRITEARKAVKTDCPFSDPDKQKTLTWGLGMCSVKYQQIIHQD